jgi:hypothetical protein
VSGVRFALIALGWFVVGCATVRAAHVGARGLWVRAAMVVSWAILAGGATLLQMNGQNDGPSRVLLGIGVVFGAVSFAANRLTHGKVD